MTTTSYSYKLKLLILLLLGSCCATALNAQSFAVVNEVLFQKNPNYHQASEQESLSHTELTSVLDEIHIKKQVDILYETGLLANKHVSQQVDYTLNTELILSNILQPYKLTYNKIDETTYTIVSTKKLSASPTKPIHSPRMVFHSSADRTSHLLKAQLIPNQIDVERIITSLEITITGQVSNEGGTPLQGATVRMKNGTSGTLTDTEGRFSLTLPDNAETIIVSYLGYETQEIAINGRTEINVTLIETESTLDEVVVIGYGTQERKDLTGAVSSVNAEEITSLPVTNVATSLQGRAAGVTVVENSGRPGTSSKVNIRGVGTVGNSDPLYVIDGQITTDINQINPNDIASIDILKDAAAGAIYGARAANGVVVITTKRGQAGKTRVSFNSYYGIQTINTDNVEFVNAEEFVTQQNEGRAFDGLDPLFDESPESFRGRSTNFWDLAWRDGFITDNVVTISGGNEQSTYLLSAGYLKNEGVQLGQDYERYTLRLNTDHKLAKWFAVGNSLQVSRAHTEAIGGTGSFNLVTNGAKIMSPTVFPEILPDGSFNGPTRPGEPAGFATFNPRQVAQEWDQLTETWQILGNVYGEITFFPGLTFRTTFHGNFLLNDGTSWQPQLEAGLSIGNNTILSRSMNTRFNWQLDNVLTYNAEFGDHKLTILGGFTAQEDVFEVLNSSVQNFLDESVQVINGGDPSTIQGNGSIQDWSINSYIGRINYAFADKYLLQANVRRDGSSRFGPENRWGVFPSFSAGWRLSQEDFFNVSFINDLKLRGSWGQLGNDQIGLYAFASAINLSQNYTLGENQTIIPGAAPLQLANPDIKWEQTTQINIGIDLAMFDNRLFINADWFQKDTEDMLLQVPVPSSSGFTQAPFVNAGEVRNDGFEFMVTYRKSTGEFQWDLSANLARIDNEVIALGSGERITLGNPANGGYHIADIGTDIFAFFGYEAEGLYQNQAEIDALNALSDEREEYDPGAGPGAIRFRDVDGDGLITDQDRTVIGSPYPDFTYGLNFRAEYKGFDLTFFVQGVQGNEIMIGPNDNFEMEPGGNLRYNLRRWSENRPTNDPVLWGWQGLRNASGGRNGRVSSAQIFDGSYLRGKNLMLGYTIPSNIVESLGLSRVRVYVNSKNLFTIWDRPDYNIFFDPELGTEGGAGNDGIVGGLGKYTLASVPQPRTLLAGININF